MTIQISDPEGGFVRDALPEEEVLIKAMQQRIKNHRRFALCMSLYWFCYVMFIASTLFTKIH